MMAHGSVAVPFRWNIASSPTALALAKVACARNGPFWIHRPPTAGQWDVATSTEADRYRLRAMTRMPIE
jgi:hypothetical protein